MNMHADIALAERMPTRTEVAGLVGLASRTVAPLWPLESAIAVNPLAGFEDMPFARAVQIAAQRFGARRSLPLPLWRAVLRTGRIEERALRDAAIRHLGGSLAAAAHIAPGVTALDLLLARMVQIAPENAPEQVGALPPDAAFIAKWCGAFFDHGAAATPMPHRELGLYRAVLALAGHDPEYRALAGKAGRDLLLQVPRDPLEAIAEGLVEIAGEADELEVLSSLVARLPGWAGHIRWRCEHADAELVAGAPATMADLLALWMLLARAGALCEGHGAAPLRENVADCLAGHFGLELDALARGALARLQAVANIEEDALGAIFMAAAEWTYANDLVPRLQGASRLGRQGVQPDAQLVFCIDVRSEPFRRALEAQGKFETLGYAGFFGLPIALHPFGGTRRSRLLPVLLSPQHDVAETVVEGREAEAGQLAEIQQRNAAGAQIFTAAKLSAGMAFATAEATGPVAALAMMGRTLAPRLATRAQSVLRKRREQAFTPALHGPGRHCGFSLEEKVGYALALFRLTGLGQDTARLVVLAGHGGSAVNNPYAAALDCGACGGHGGGHNARLLAAMLNDPAVREALAEHDVAIPQSTLFLAAEHDTTTDEVRIFDRDLVPESHREDLARLDAGLARAGQQNRVRRAGLLGRSPGELLAGAGDWSEVRPEWGLAGNAGFIVGPRWLSQDIDLDGRAFLHSYDWRADADGTALTTILTAPMVVAQWINCQYLFSTIDNQRYGSGDKVTQNLIGRIGVVQGNGGDLKVGLPRQSLFKDDGTPFHVPQRLLAIVHAPTDRVARVVEANDILGRLFGNGWVQLVVIDPETGRASRWREGEAVPGEGRDQHSLTC